MPFAALSQDPFQFPPEVHIQQMSNRRFLDAYENSNNYLVTTRTQQGGDQEATQIWILIFKGMDNQQNAEYTIQQKYTMRYLDAYESGMDNQATTREWQNGHASQIWVLKMDEENPNSDIYTIQQKSTYRYLDAADGGEYEAVTREAQGGDQRATQHWIISPAIPCLVSATPVGRWHQLMSFDEGGQLDFTYGTSRGYSSTFSWTWGTEVSVAVEAGFKPFGMGADVTVTGSMSSTLGGSDTKSFQQSYSKTTLFSWSSGGVVWQWIYDVVDACGTSTVFGLHFARTDHADSPPCCLPGFFSVPEETRGTCKPGSYADYNTGCRVAASAHNHSVV